MSKSFYVPNGKFPKVLVLVDKEDYSEISKFKWYAHNGYIYSTPTINGKKIHLAMHRFILKITNRDIFVDHINRNKSDNRKCNLRPCNCLENSRYGSNKVRGISKYRGVSKSLNPLKPWRAYYRNNKKYKFLGNYSTQEEAALAYNKAVAIHYGEFANLNIITN